MRCYCLLGRCEQSRHGYRFKNVSEILSLFQSTIGRDELQPQNAARCQGEVLYMVPGGTRADRWMRRVFACLYADRDMGPVKRGPVYCVHSTAVWNGPDGTQVEPPSGCPVWERTAVRAPVGAVLGNCLWERLAWPSRRQERTTGDSLPPATSATVLTPCQGTLDRAPSYPEPDDYGDCLKPCTLYQAKALRVRFAGLVWFRSGCANKGG